MTGWEFNNCGDTKRMYFCRALFLTLSFLNMYHRLVCTAGLRTVKMAKHFNSSKLKMWEGEITWKRNVEQAAHTKQDSKWCTYIAPFSKRCTEGLWTVGSCDIGTTANCWWFCISAHMQLTRKCFSGSVLLSRESSALPPEDISMSWISGNTEDPKNTSHPGFTMKRSHYDITVSVLRDTAEGLVSNMFFSLH